jgi:hypothetical protein
MAHRGETQQHTSRSADTYCVNTPTRHRGFVARSCPEANYKWSPQARHDDETRTTCVRARHVGVVSPRCATKTQASQDKTTQAPKQMLSTERQTTLCLLRTACVLLLLRVFCWAPMQGSHSRGASSERRTEPPAGGSVAVRWCTFVSAVCLLLLLFLFSFFRCQSFI